MEWTPQQEGLREILTLLKESQSPDTVTQRAVQQVSFYKAKYTDYACINISHDNMGNWAMIVFNREFAIFTSKFVAIFRRQKNISASSIDITHINGLF